ncbi:MAG: NAD(P)H-dependent oxidoreductase [Bacteroidota bacterium]
MSIIDSLKWRYATKKFDSNKTLSEEKLTVLKEAFNLTATSFGLQTIKMIVIEDKAVREQLVEHSFFQNQVLDASHLLVICIQDDIKTEDVNSHFENVKDIRSTPDTILKPFRNDLTEMMEQKSVNERQDWSIRQAYITLGNLMTVCAVEKIDSCPMEGFVPEQYDKILGLQELGLKSVLLLPVGYRAEDDMFADFKKVRKGVEESVIER